MSARVDERYVAAAILGLSFVVWNLTTSSTRKINAPSVGPGLGIIGVFDFMKNGRTRLQEGYDKYAPSSRSFKVPMMDYWNIIVTGKNVHELRTVPEEKLSFEAAAADLVAMPYTMGPNFQHNMYHIPVIRRELTRNLPVLLPDVLDEIVHAFEDIITFAPGQEWTKIQASESVREIVCRATNRVLVGLPTCREPEYLKLGHEFTMNVVISSVIVNLFPGFLKPLIGRLLSRVPEYQRRAGKYIIPLIKQREKLEPTERPNDFLTWLMAAAEERATSTSVDPAVAQESTTPEFMTLLMLGTVFVSLHTSSTAFTSTLYHLAAKEKAYMPELREEVEAAIKECGWSKATLVKMRKVDSFFRESARWSSLGGTVMARKAMEDYTFADGTFIPKGHVVSTALYATHLDPTRYGPTSDQFDGFRFANMRQGDGEGSKYQLVSTSADFLPFGHGTHACPGRFFAANELKMMMAYLVLNYDIKMENEGVRPEDEWFGAACIPNRTAEVMFRRRRAASS